VFFHVLPPSADRKIPSPATATSTADGDDPSTAMAATAKDGKPVLADRHDVPPSTVTQMPLVGEPA
jgi:hypothetical protein